MQANARQGIRPPLVGTDKIRDLIQASYQRNTGARNIGAKHGLTLDNSLSNAEQKVYVDKSGNPTVSFAGSRKISDWLITNPMLALGLEKYSPRFRRSEKVLEDVRKKYNKPALVTGHSLGGAIAAGVGGKNDKIVTVDRGVGIGGIGRKVRSNTTNIRASNDLVSALTNTQTGARNIVIKDKGNLNVLKAHDYKLLDRLGNKLV